MNVLLVGSGAREHALAWKLRQSPKLTDLFVAPGNAGTAALGTNLPLKASDVEGLTRAAKENRCELAVVGPQKGDDLGERIDTVAYRPHYGRRVVDLMWRQEAQADQPINLAEVVFD